ncbi:MAG: hypothetical protein Q4E39_05575 [bacterium]|nr:hypothetical protein [bacterium]
MQSKVRYKSIKTNDEYITIPVKINGLSLFLVDDERVSSDVYKELQSVYFGILNFEKEQCIYVRDDIALRKDSILGRFILSHPENFINDDTDVTYKKVVDAYSVATFEDNTKMANKILPLFKGRVSGRKEELADICDLKVLDFILNNGDFDEYLNNLDGKEKTPRRYIVYEDEKYFFSDLAKEKPNVKVKK